MPVVVTGFEPMDILRGVLAAVRQLEGNLGGGTDYVVPDDFEADLDAEGLTVVIRGCPWRDLLAKSKREHLGARIAEAVCMTEGQVWAQEFGGAYEFEIPELGCAGAKQCEMRFRIKRS